LKDNPYESTNAVGLETNCANLPVRRWSLALSAVLLNFAVWQLGIFFDSFGGAIDSLGASLCIATWFLAPILIGGAIAYSPIRRFLMPVRTWDFYGPAISILVYLIMRWQLVLGPLG